MLKKLTFICLLLMFSFNEVFAQDSETISLIVSDQNGDLITVGIVSLTYFKGKKVAELELGKIKKTPSINVAVGSLILEIQSPGFKTYQKQIEIKKGLNNFEIKLELEEIKVNIEVEQSQRERRIDEAFSGYLTEREISSLPESG